MDYHIEFAEFVERANYIYLYRLLHTGKEFEESESVRIRQKQSRGLFGTSFKDYDYNNYPSKRETLKENGLKAWMLFCDENDIPYVITYSTQYGPERKHNMYGDASAYGDVSVEREEVFTKTISFEITPQKAEELVHKDFSDYAISFIKTAKEKSGEWYERMRKAEVADTIADKAFEFFSKKIEEEIKNNYENNIAAICSYCGVRVGNDGCTLSWVTDLNDYEHYIDHKAPTQMINIEYSELGYRPLETDSQKYGLIAVVVNKLRERIQMQDGVFDVCVRTVPVIYHEDDNASWSGHGFNEIVIFYDYAEPQKPDVSFLKEW